jgi:acetyl-CoA C-acetyltransferase
VTSRHSVVFAEPVRTAIGTFGGSLKDVPNRVCGLGAQRSSRQRRGLPSDTSMSRWRAG